MSVRNLFWNVPVRLKFLKNQAAETAQVTDMLTRLALGHPECAFELSAEGRQIFSVPDQQSIKDRVGSLLGRDLASGLMQSMAQLNQPNYPALSRTPALPGQPVSANIFI